MCILDKIKEPHDLLFRDAPDERDLSVMRQFHDYISTRVMLMSIQKTGADYA